MLLVLDNCEHLNDPIAALARALLAECPELTLVATSRELLDIPGETIFHVPPLTVPDPTTSVAAPTDAVRLFCERAHAIEPRFRLTSANGEAVAQICRRLDGIPLAIELVAARIRMVSCPGQL